MINPLDLIKDVDASCKANKELIEKAKAELEINGTKFVREIKSTTLNPDHKK
jgi:hypothetical protein